MRAKRATIITSAIFELWKLFSSGNAELSFEDLPIHLKFLLPAGDISKIRDGGHFSRFNVSDQWV